MKNRRKVKVSRKYNYSNSSSYPTIAPKIVLAGKWLQQAGFSSGQNLSIEVFEKMLVISLS
ncbi:SymE family type I addiction module toxin [Flectobacillus roseus]|uniref:SymE family type I addiction module toxin n=1 Tax=Flectobacillus roseus TaxID=502259 RepID=UPI0024B6900A|nr:SymE family type I addiction module toxin [Flectobacillus roseus]MDI9870576.1 SymE family type I addiction module toxin [Flectobacillus roseus]